MSKVSRSIFQKVCEENKRLLADIRLLTTEEYSMESFNCMIKWQDKFKKEKEFSQFMREIAKEYIKEHADELPDFLTDGIKE